MRSSRMLTLVSACSSAVPAARAISLEKCSYRMTNMQHGQEATYKLAIFDCDFDEELYLKSRIDDALPPIVSTASKDDVAAGIAESIVSSVPWANFAGLTIAGGSAVPNSLFTLSHNVKLGCQHGEDDIAFELFQKPSHAPPADFLYSLPPTKNSINELWQAFGAYKWPESPLPRRMSVGLMVDVGFISQDQLETCIDEGKLIMSADTSPLEDCPDCSFVPKGSDDGCSKEECSIWHYSDSAGTAVNPLSSVLVERSDYECSMETFTNFTSERLPLLYELLESSKTKEESEAAMLSYSTIVNDIDYAACKDVFDSLYTTKSASLFMKGVRGCEDPNNEEDPCCNEAMMWSDCCLPEDKHIEIEGVFNATNFDAVNSICGANGPAVSALLDSEISQVLISASHPEFGCSAAYEKVVPKHGDSDIFRTLWDESPVSKCEEEVRWGKSTTGLDTCNANEECWSGSCVSDGGSLKRCTQLYGEAIAGPLLSCIASRIDVKVWRYMSNVLNIDPSKVKKGGEFKGTKWNIAVGKFKDLVGSPNCVGDEAERGICAIVDITKEECSSINHPYDWSRQMEWVADETNPNGGFCKKRDSSWHEAGIYVHGHTEDVQKECQAIFDGMEGTCVDSTMPNGRFGFKSESECTGESESWHSFSSRTIGGFRLASQRIWTLEETSGNWVDSFRQGDKDKCTLQTTCNWDPENRITSGSEELCLDPSPLETTTYPRASFEEDGKHMTCLACWGSRCDDFWAANPPICAVRPHGQDDCAENSGGGPNNDPPVTAMMSLQGHDSHVKCRRNDLKTESECLSTEFCPLPSEDVHPWEEWLHHCAESSCWDLAKDKGSCHYDEMTQISFHWNDKYRGGQGACQVHYHHNEEKSFDEKSYCESKGFVWWEGRAFKPGAFHDADECTTYCNDGTWPIQKTCSSGSCNEHCAQCVEGDSWRFPDGAACYLSGEIDQDWCYSHSDYEWDWSTKLCYRKNFSGNEADCVDLDESGSDNDDLLSMSMSMSMMTSSDFDFYEAEAPKSSSLTHNYVSCPAQAEESCAAYCWAKDHDDYTTCQNEGLEWDWSLSRCKHSAWMVNTDSSPTCESYTAGLDESATVHERWDRAEKCWSNGCHFEAGDVGATPPTCTGQPRGCAQQNGNTEWVDGGDESTASAKILLGCRWDMWRSCPTEETCVNAGECEDWFMGNEGKCIVPIEPNEWGHRKGCHEVKHPVDGTSYDWADKLGCVARKTEDGTTKYVKEDECSSVGGTFHVRAKSKEQCEDDRGDVCTHPFDEWRVFGGIDSEEKCDTCGYKTMPPTKWRTGVWSDSAETPLYWVERAFSTKNKWEENSFDSSAFHALVRNSISRYIADAFKSKVYCELGAYNAFIPAIISMCSADGDNEQNMVKYDLTTSKVSCGDLQDQPPMETYEGSISYANAECTNSDDTFAETTMGKVVPLVGSSGRRTTSSSVCSLHEVIENSNEQIVGQKLGSGLSFTGVNNATVCIKPTVPDSEVCSNYVEFGVSTVDDAGSYSVPLSKSTTVNPQGEICFDGSENGVTYVPVKLMSGWQTVSDTTTQAPTVSTMPTRSPSTTQAPSKSPTSATSESPTVSSIQGGSSAPSTSSSPSAIDSSQPSMHPSMAPSALGDNPSVSLFPSMAPSLSLAPSAMPSSSTAPSLSLAPSTLPSSSLPPSGLDGTPSVSPSVIPSNAPSKNGTGKLEVSFEVAVKLDGMPNPSDLSVDSLNSIADLLKKVFLSMVPQGTLVRLLKVAGFEVSRRLIRFLEEGGAGGVDVEFEVIMTKRCDTAACDNSEAISSTLYNQVTGDLRARVEDGEVSRAIQEEAELEGVSELSNVTVSSDSFSATAAKVTVEEAEAQTTEAPTTAADNAGSDAPTADNAGSASAIVVPIMLMMPLLVAVFGMP